MRMSTRPDDSGPPMHRRDAERILAAEMLDAFRTMEQTMTRFIAHLGGRIVNDTLEVATRTFDTSGATLLQFGSVCGSIEVTNAGTHLITVASGASNTTTAPTTGVGVHLIPAGAVRLVNIAARELTVYGTSGDSFSYQAFAGGGVAGASLVAIDGGAA